MTRHWLVALSVSALLGTATAASAQVDPVEWHKGTALAVFAGAASATGGTDAAAGAAIGWELTPHFSLEGSGLWMPGGGVDSFSALFGSRVNLLSPRGVVPFVSAGVGVHRAVVEGGHGTCQASTCGAWGRRRRLMPGCDWSGRSTTSSSRSAEAWTSTSDGIWPCVPTCACCSFARTPARAR